MTEIVLNKLYDLQDTTIEHKLPNWNGNISFFVEAAGDIYREICHDPADFGGYIAEKRQKLKTFSELNDADIKEIRDTLKKHSDWYDKLDEYIVLVDNLYTETKNFAFDTYAKAKIYGTDTYPDRKNAMLAALETIQAICIYAEGEFTKVDVDRKIKNLNAMLIEKKPKITSKLPKGVKVRENEMLKEQREYYEASEAKKQKEFEEAIEARKQRVLEKGLIQK
jgi:hypothetical protein